MNINEKIYPASVVIAIKGGGGGGGREDKALL